MELGNKQKGEHYDIGEGLGFNLCVAPSSLERCPNFGDGGDIRGDVREGGVLRRETIKNKVKIEDERKRS